MPDYLTSIHRERMPIHPQIPFKPPGVALTAFSQMLYMNSKVKPGGPSARREDASLRYPESASTRTS